MAQAAAGRPAADRLRAQVIGAGLAGLAAACHLTEAGVQVVLHDSAPAAGGRARSYFDKTLGVRIDNGNHLVLSGNTATHEYLARIGATDALAGPVAPIYPFIDLGTGERWTLRLSSGAMPWWVLNPARRVRGTTIGQYGSLLKLKFAAPDALVGPTLGAAGTLYRRLLEPLAISALNTMPDIAACGPLQKVFAETLERGGRAAIPRYARIGLSESFVDPALAWLAARGADIRLGARVTEIDPAIPTILAVPPWIAATLVDGLVVPTAFEAICNLHFLTRVDPGEAGFWGFVGGLTEWAFARPETLSVTISAANRYADRDNDDIAATVWAELSRSLGLPAAMPPHRVVWERRATFEASAPQLARRPGAATAHRNLTLAGDWTATGLPSTIEGAIRSGFEAAALLIKNR
jgi:squalene-associated FAD-dependent desaturase